MVTLMLDVIIIGGGPAGLGAALVLGRCLRRVVVLDAGHPRNEGSAMFNGYLSRDGSSPAEFLSISRGQLNRYDTVQLRAAEVRSVAREKDAFSATLLGGETLRGRTMLLATGVADVLPPILGLREAYGRTVHSCPYCHGWECRNQALGVIGGDTQAAELALELLQWSRDIMVFANGRFKGGWRAKRRLQRSGITIQKGAITRLDGREDTRKGVWCSDGSFVEREAFFLVPSQIQRSSFAQELGCKMTKHGCIACRDDGSTSIPGLFTAGNARRGIQLVIAAVAEGTVAGMTINTQLLEADTLLS
jgi:thioredoxin reductase